MASPDLPQVLMPGFKIPLLGWASIIQPDRAMRPFLFKVIRMTKNQREYVEKHFGEYNICSVLGKLVQGKQMGIHGTAAKPRTRLTLGQDFSCPLVFLRVRKEVWRSD